MSPRPALPAARHSVWSLCCATLLTLWCLPLTLVGYVVLLFAFKDKHIKRRGVRMAYGATSARLLRVFGYQAMTIGAVVLARNRTAMRQHLAHEWAHIHQSRRFGVLFPALYLGHSAWCLLTRRHPYLHNTFERAACHFADSRSCRSDAPSRLHQQ